VPGAARRVRGEIVKRTLALWTLGALVVTATGPSYAAEVIFSEAVRVGERYRVRVEMRIAVPADQSFAMLTDYAHLSRLNPGIVESEVLESTDRHHRVRLATRGCLMFFCRTLRQVQTVSESNGRMIDVRIEAAQSDFNYGRLLWRITPAGPEASRVSFSAEVEPAGWVPPLIGPWAIRRFLEEQTQSTIRRIEEIATP